MLSEEGKVKYMNCFGIDIIGAGKYLPEKLITNEMLSKIVDTTDEWITQRVGIDTRHAADGEFTFQMGQKAAQKALEDASVDPAEIDMVIGTTVTLDYTTPSMACLIANGIGVKNAICFDINAACAAFVYGIETARRYLMDGTVKTALVVSSEMLTKHTDYTDRSTCVLFGDGAGAVVIRASDKQYSCYLNSDTTGSTKLFARSAPNGSPFLSKPFDYLSDGLPDSKGIAIYQDGKDVYKFATRALPLAVEQACKKAGIESSELKLIFSHQANRRIIETAAKNLGVSMDKFFVNIQKHGNMSSACIPICLAEAREQDLLTRGDKICLVGFGAGLVYGAIVIEY